MGERQAVDLALIECVRSDDGRSMEILLHRYRWLAKYRARQCFLAGSTEQDIAQEAMIGLFKAIRDFDPAAQTPLVAFADLCIKRQIASALKAANRQKHFALNSALSLDLPAEDADWSEITIGDRLAAPPTRDPSLLVISSEQIESIRDHLTKSLTALENDVLELSLQGLSYDQIAEILDAHRKRIDNALQRVRAKLRAHLAAEESA